ncbi:MAG TPA: tetratricopeptide repeat protein [Methylomirabilota bacterium]
MDPRSRLVTLAGTADARSLAEGALWIAAEAHPDLDVQHRLGHLDALGYRAAERTAGDMDVDRAAAAVARFLSDEEGFRGNAEDYYDPRNSFLDDVLDRRLGIPITLSVVYMAVAARAGLEAVGVGLPGHFVVRVARRGQHRFLDPFHGGALLDRAGCEALVARVRPGGGPLDPRWLAPVTTRQILVRMLANLKAVYSTLGDWSRALGATERILLLVPDAAEELRDRGMLHARLGQGQAALRDWEAYLQRAPEASDARQVRDRLRALRQALGALN